jgi:putative cell wall-binding protein
VRGTAPTSTSGVVVEYGGSIIDALYFSSSAGRTQHNEDVFGSTPVPYLRSVADAWSLTSSNPNVRWWRTVGQTDLATAFGLPDVVRLDLSSRTTGGYVKVARAWSSTGTTSVVDGDVLRSRLGLKSAALSRETTRLAGPDRFGTAAAVAREVYPSASSVVVVDGRDAHLVDGLVAGPLSGATRAPILLSWGSVLPAASVSELDRRGSVVRRAYVVGGEAAVPQEVVSVLRARGLEVVRLSGATRFETAAAVAREIKRVTGMSVFSTVLASGAEANLVDALAASGPAAGELRPILLTEPGKLPSITGQLLRELSASYVMTVGGPAAVSDSVLSEVRALGFRVGRVGGADRYETAAAIASAFYPYLDVRDDVVLASGAQANLVDALSAGALERAVLLTPPTTLPAASRGFLQTGALLRRVTAVGGPAAVADGTLTMAGQA